MKSTFTVLPVVTAIAAAALAGCAMDPTHVEDDFGNSVRQMVSAQIYDPVVASNPDALPPLIGDGDAASAGISGYRSDAAREERSEYRGTILQSGDEQ